MYDDEENVPSNGESANGNSVGINGAGDFGIIVIADGEVAGLLGGS